MLPPLLAARRCWTHSSKIACGSVMCRLSRTTRLRQEMRPMHFGALRQATRAPNSISSKVWV